MYLRLGHPEIDIKCIVIVLTDNINLAIKWKKHCTFPVE